jgi:hypothetical protein
MTHNQVTEIFQFLRPNGGWVVSGEDIENAVYDEGIERVTKTEFDAAVVSFANLKENERIAAATAKSNLLAKLGITEDEAKLLLS